MTKKYSIILLSTLQSNVDLTHFGTLGTIRTHETVYPKVTLILFIILHYIIISRLCKQVNTKQIFCPGQISFLSHYIYFFNFPLLILRHCCSARQRCTFVCLWERAEKTHAGSGWRIDRGNVTVDGSQLSGQTIVFHFIVNRIMRGSYREQLHFRKQA